MKETYSKLANFGKELLNKTSLVEGVPLISKYAKEIIGADRCSIFIYNSVKDELWTTMADGIEKIIIPSDKGIVGHTLEVKKPLLVHDAESDPLFLSAIDKNSGYKTNNLVTAPVFNSEREVIGVLQLLNKETGFNEDDVKCMKFFAHYISGFLELSTLYAAE
jgi:signal transduction protein with GAF and PtsI domain